MFLWFLAILNQNLIFPTKLKNVPLSLICHSRAIQFCFIEMYKITLSAKLAKKLTKDSLFHLFLKLIKINYIFSNNVHMYYILMCHFDVDLIVVLQLNKQNKARWRHQWHKKCKVVEHRQNHYLHRYYIYLMIKQMKIHISLMIIQVYTVWKPEAATFNFYKVKARN